MVLEDLPEIYFSFVPFLTHPFAKGKVVAGETHARKAINFINDLLELWNFKQCSHQEIADRTLNDDEFSKIRCIKRIRKVNLHLISITESIAVWVHEFGICIPRSLAGFLSANMMGFTPD